jgi:hypothetical protein
LVWHFVCIGISRSKTQEKDSMATTQTLSRPVRAAVFASTNAAERAVRELQAAGFSERDITVVCSDETKERSLRRFEHQQPAGTNTPAAAATGGVIGATLFGLTAIAASATGGIPLAIAGGWALLTGGVAGGFLGAMLTRGVEKEAANFYDQAVAAGKILVAVEVHGQAAERRLAQAGRILDQAGAEPLPLTEG